MPWYIPHPGFLEQLPEEGKQRMGIIYPPRNYRKWKTVYHASDPCNELYIVLEGTLKLSRLSDGAEEHIVWVAVQGDILGTFLSQAPGSAP